MWTFLIGISIGFLLSISMLTIGIYRVLKITAVLKHTSKWKSLMDRLNTLYILMNKLNPSEVSEIANRISNNKIKF